MQRAKAAAVAATAIALALGTSTARAKDKTPANITVAFGAGLNTASPGNTPNHHIIPQEFTVRITKAKKLDETTGSSRRRSTSWSRASTGSGCTTRPSGWPT